MYLSNTTFFDSRDMYRIYYIKKLLSSDLTKMILRSTVSKTSTFMMLKDRVGFHSIAQDHRLCGEIYRTHCYRASGLCLLAAGIIAVRD